MGIWGGLMMTLMALMWIAIPALIAWAAWTASRPNRKHSNPLDILKETYARGQISHDQYEQTKKDLV